MPNSLSPCLDRRAVDVVDVGQEPLHAGDEIDRLEGRGIARQVEVERHRLLQRLRHGDFRRGRRDVGVFRAVAARENERGYPRHGGRGHAPAPTGRKRKSANTATAISKDETCFGWRSASCCRAEGPRLVCRSDKAVGVCAPLGPFSAQVESYGNTRGVCFINNQRVYDISLLRISRGSFRSSSSCGRRNVTPFLREAGKSLHSDHSSSAQFIPCAIISDMLILRECAERFSAFDLIRLQSRR